MLDSGLLLKAPLPWLVAVCAGCCCTASKEGGPAAEAEVRSAESAWSSTGSSGDLETFVAFYVDYATLAPPNRPRATGKEAIRSVVRELFALPSFTLRFDPDKVEVARSRELAYARGTYQLSFKNPQGAQVTDRGKYVAVYRRQPNGSWKAVEDIFNSDLPAAH